MTKKKTLKNLEFLYELALKKGKWHIALRAMEIQGKALGLLRHQPLPPVKRLSDMTEEQLRDFIARLEESDPTLRQEEAALIEDLPKTYKDERPL